MKNNLYNVPGLNRDEANVYLNKAGLAFFIVYRYVRSHFPKYLSKLDT